jgi:hypothetical protein
MNWTQIAQEAMRRSDWANQLAMVASSTEHYDETNYAECKAEATHARRQADHARRIANTVPWKCE